MDDNEKAIARTLAYSDIFDYPLKEDEIWKFLISEKKIDKDTFKKKVRRINTIVYRNSDHLYLKGKEHTVIKRLEKQKISAYKLEMARNTIRKLFSIPTVSFIGISGNLSMMNSGKNDDIDLFVITKRNSVWITRFMLIIYLKVLGKHRKRGEKEVSNKFCLNMLIDENRLTFSEKFRNIYTAHEIIQMVPIMQRGNIFGTFLELNKWVENYMPNSISESKKQILKTEKHRFGDFISLLLSALLIEKVARLLQGISIKRNLSMEIIEKDWIALHPKDYQGQIISSYSQKLSYFGI